MKHRRPPSCPALTTEQIGELLEAGRLVIEAGIVSQVCRSCGEEWPYDTEFFPPHPNQKFGIDIHCRCCRNEQFREQKRRARAAGNQQQHRSTPCPAEA